MNKNKVVIGVVDTEAQADSLVRSLSAGGFMDTDISLIFPDTRGSKDLGYEANTKAPEGTVVGASSGGVLGGALGLLAGIGALAIPGLGPFIAAGPLMAALSGAAVGAAVGGVTGALVGLGIPEIEAKMYEGKLRSGNIVLAVHAVDGEQADRAKLIFQHEGAHDVTTTSESSVPSSDHRHARA